MEVRASYQRRLASSTYAMRHSLVRLIEVKGIGETLVTILLTLNERRAAEDRRECYWLYVVTNCNAEAKIQEPIKDPARFPWHEVTEVAHYYLSVDALTQPMQVREDEAPHGEDIRESIIVYTFS